MPNIRTDDLYEEDGYRRGSPSRPARSTSG
jgi:hypothetical protein